MLKVQWGARSPLCRTVFMRRRRLSPRRQSWRGAPGVGFGRSPGATRRVQSLLPRSSLISFARSRLEPGRALKRSSIVRGIVRSYISSPVKSFLLPRGGAFARPSSVKDGVCVSKQKRRESLFARGVAGSSWKRINMRGAVHDGRRC